MLSTILSEIFISIHAPRMECNLTAFASPWMPWNFNPRTREGCD